MKKSRFTEAHFRAYIAKRPICSYIVPTVYIEALPREATNRPHIELNTPHDLRNDHPSPHR